MKKLYILLISLLLTGVTLNAQPNREQQQKRIKALKTAHITDALDLTPEEAQKFWPVYNANANKMDKIRGSQRREARKVMEGGFDNMTDAEANSLLDKHMEFRQNEIVLQKELVTNLRGVIPPQKILKLQWAEETFKRKLLDEIRKRRKKN